MNKTAIKNFSIWARNKLIADISYRAGLMGITENGIADSLSQSTDTMEFYDIGTADPYTISGIEVRQRKDLVDAIHRKEADSDYETAYNYIIEEVAYTWFNRLIAVRFMEVNDYLPSHIRVLSAESGKMEPDLVTTPFDAGLEFTAEEEKQIINLKRENALDEIFRLLFVRQCNALNSILPGLFEKTGDYTELLLNLSVTNKDGVVYHLVHDIDEEDFDIETKDENGDPIGQVEIIGWLYQYYNTEPKAKVFDRPSGTKIKKEEIPAATQLFTPDWIVRYMVENSLGRLWVEGHPDNELKTSWKYYLDEAEQEPEVEAQLDEIRKEHSLLTPEDIKFIDPCMGSGHILVYAFDVLMQIYETQGYTKQDAVKSILKNNLYGLDIDERAVQLSYFSVMMKARCYDKRFFSRDIQPHVYAIQESNNLSKEWLPIHRQMQVLFDCMEDAKDYGSLIVTPDLDYNMLRCSAQNRLQEIGQVDFEIDEMQQQLSEVLSLIDVAEILSQKYDIVVTNPPYMGASNMNAKLGDFIKHNYSDYKSDFFSAFIVRCKNMGKQEGNLGFFSPYVWMFIQSYEKLRNLLYSKATIETLIQFEYSAFEEATVPVCTFTIRNKKIEGEKGCYLRLTEFRGGMEVQREKALEAIVNHNCGFYFEQCSENFSKIPGSPVVYWASENVIKDFEDGIPVGEIAECKRGMTTSDNNLFLRFWAEVDKNKIKFNAKSQEEALISKARWFPYSKGGGYRKWYGFQEFVIDWENNGERVINFAKTINKSYTRTIVNIDYYFKPSVGFCYITSGPFSMRWIPEGFLYDSGGPGMFANEHTRKKLIACMNSKPAQTILKMISPTINLQIADIIRMPFMYNDDFDIEIVKAVERLIEISKKDWDSFETSWDFKCHPFIRWSRELFDATSISATMNYYYGYLPEVKSPIELSFLLWQGECNDRFEKLKNNEEELNRIFIEIYGLQDELSPEVEDKDVTVRKADLQRDIRSFLSYAVGCMFGRYSLDINGLAYAGGEWDDSKYQTYQPDFNGILPICDDEYFTDDIVGHFVDFIRTVYGSDSLEENLQFIADALGGKGPSREAIRKYFLNDFFADHCKIYQKRPIYWLFDSGKKNGFKCLIYLHRYQPDTIARIRTDYVHEQQARYRTAIADLENRIETASTSDRIKLNKELKKVQEQADELHDYEEKIHHLADQYIDIDLDDGVKVNYAKFQDVLAKIK